MIHASKINSMCQDAGALENRAFLDSLLSTSSVLFTRYIPHYPKITLANREDYNQGL